MREIFYEHTCCSYNNTKYAYQLSKIVFEVSMNTSNCITLGRLEKKHHVLDCRIYTSCLICTRDKNKIVVLFTWHLSTVANVNTYEATVWEMDGWYPSSSSPYSLSSWNSLPPPLPSSTSNSSSSSSLSESVSSLELVLAPSLFPSDSLLSSLSLLE